MVAPVTSKASVRSQTQISEVEAISDSSRSRIGSLSALNMGASWPAVPVSSGSAASGGQHAGVAERSSTGRTDMRLA